MKGIVGGKATGLDNILCQLLKWPPCIFNELLLTGIYPSDWKLAPIFKNGSETVLNNYRPISVIPAVAKIFNQLASTYTHFPKKALAVSVHLSESDLLFPCALHAIKIYKGLIVRILSTTDLFEWLDSTAEGETSKTTKSCCQIKSIRLADNFS